MNSQIQFLDDVRLVLIKDDEGLPVRAVFELPGGAIECHLLPVTNVGWQTVLPKIEHQVTHVVQAADQPMKGALDTNWPAIAALAVVTALATALPLGTVAGKIG